MAIMRSRKASPGFARDPHDQPVGEDLRTARDRTPVTAALADDGRALAGDRALVRPTRCLRSTSPSAGMTSPASTRTTSPFRRAVAGDGRVRGVPLRLVRASWPGRRGGPPQGVRLGLAPSLRHRLGEVGEQDREPEPHGPRDEPGGRLTLADEGLDEEPRRQDGSHVDDEHDRVADLDSRGRASGRSRPPPAGRWAGSNERALPSRALHALCLSSLDGRHDEMLDDRSQRERRE